MGPGGAKSFRPEKEEEEAKETGDWIVERNSQIQNLKLLLPLLLTPCSINSIL
jgi:hypothetical protein